MAVGNFDLPPSWVLGAAIALTYAAAFKVAAPRQTRGIFVCAVVAVFGFFVGNFLSGALGVTAFRVGELNLLGSSFVSLLALTIANLWRA